MFDRRSLLLALVASLLSAPLAAQDRVPVIAAASDLKFALERIATDFEKESGRKLRLNFGSSGNFARQIRQGAPFELFLSADESYVKDLAAAGLTRDEGALYAVGRIALYLPKGSKIPLDAQLKGLREAMPRLNKFAIANPEHAPYGRAAQEALQKAGVWEGLQRKLVIGENISQAAQFVATGSADAGIVALSLALAPELARSGKHLVLPAELHSPLRQRMVLTKQAGETAQAFYRYLQTPAARRVFEQYGFTLPER